MADAVCTDIGRYGAQLVAVLVVSHTDAEDLADRVRARLAATGTLTGPALVGPGWTAEREYQAGDRVLIHARCGPSGSPARQRRHRHGHRATGDGLTVLLDGSGEAANLPTAFVQGTRKDGSPNSRTPGHARSTGPGGTWEACHLLGSAALDAYRGYTGQSRSRQPTHPGTPPGGGRRPRRCPGRPAGRRRTGRRRACPPARPVPGRTQRPLGTDCQLRERIAEHEGVLGAPGPRTDERALVAAAKDLQAGESRLADKEGFASRTADQLAAVGALAGLTRRGREQRRWLQDRLASDAGCAAAAKDNCDGLANRTSRLRREQDALDRFEVANGWRRDDI